jgi:hypothetical protein
MLESLGATPRFETKGWQLRIPAHVWIREIAFTTDTLGREWHGELAFTTEPLLIRGGILEGTMKSPLVDPSRLGTLTMSL